VSFFSTGRFSGFLAAKDNSMMKEGSISEGKGSSSVSVCVDDINT